MLNVKLSSALFGSILPRKNRELCFVSMKKYNSENMTESLGFTCIHVEITYTYNNVFDVCKIEFVIANTPYFL